MKQLTATNSTRDRYEPQMLNAHPEVFNLTFGVVLKDLICDQSDVIDLKQLNQVTYDLKKI